MKSRDNSPWPNPAEDSPAATQSAAGAGTPLKRVTRIGISSTSENPAVQKQGAQIGQAKQPSKVQSAAMPKVNIGGAAAKVAAKPASPAAAMPGTSTKATAASASGSADQPTEEESKQSRSVKRLLRGVPSWLISFVVHCILIVCLAVVTFVPKLDPPKLELFSSSIEASEELEMLDQPVEIETPQELSAADASMPAMDAPNVAMLAEPTAMPAAEVSNVGEIAAITSSARDFGALISGEELGTPSLGKGGGTTQFFGTKSAAQKVVFVIDNSNSMTGGRFETALNELVKAVDRMDKNQQFYVIFFSDTAYELFHPDKAKSFVYATSQNKQKLRYWLTTVQLCLNTRGRKAMERAVELKPDVIYLLGDGAFTDDTQQMMTGPLKGKVTVHTLGMEVQQKEVAQFAAIAKANKGTFKDVGIAPEAAMMAKRNRIPRNKTRGPVWGLALPPAK